MLHAANHFKKEGSRDEPSERLVSAGGGQSAAVFGSIDLSANELLVESSSLREEIRENALIGILLLCRRGSVRHRAGSGTVRAANDSDGLCAHRSSSSLDCEGGLSPA